MRILLIEDNREEATRIKELLKENGCLTDIAFTAQSGVELAEANIYHVIILSYDLSAGLSNRILSNIRGRGIGTPILVIGKDMNTSKMEACFVNGADDFLSKPFDKKILMLRLKVINKRQKCVASYFRLGDIEFIPDLHLVKGVSGEVNLTGKESLLLELLIINRHQILPKVIIEERLWPNSDDFSDNNIEVHMSNLRKKLRGMTELLTIETIRNAGYSMKLEEDQLYTGKVY